MPKTLVLCSSPAGHTAALADAIVEGARSVRFAEVDVRCLEHAEAGSDPALAAKYRPLESVDALAGYDAIVLGAPADGAGVPAALARLLDAAGALRARGALVDVVGSAFTAAADDGHETALWSILASLGTLGMILVPPAATGGEGALAAAREQGRRVATVAGWVRHAKGHEHGHSHSHAH
jgi:NAD(P)H dehydrogenase (quinone)